MAEPFDTPFDANASSEIALSSEPLGIQHPLLPAQSLGQRVPNLKFMVPLGAQPLAVLNPSIFFSEGGSEYAEVAQPFAESPFFDTSASTVVDREPEPRRAELPHPAASSTLVQRQVAAPSSSAALPSETTPIQIQEQEVRVPGADSREPTGLLDSTVEPPISPNTPITSEFSSSEIAIASGVESSIQRLLEAAPFTPTQPTVRDRSLPTQPDSTPAIPSKTQSIPEPQSLRNPAIFPSDSSQVVELPHEPTVESEMGSFAIPDATEKAILQESDPSSTLETTLQPQLEPSSKVEAPSSPSNSALVEAVPDTNASAIESSLHSSRLAESSNEAPTVQLAADSPVHKVLTPTSVEQPFIPEPPLSSESIGNEAIETQRFPAEQTEDSFSQTPGLPLEQAEDSSLGQPESPTRFGDFFPSGTQSQSTSPVVQTYPASEAAIQREPVATPQAPELSAAALSTNSPTDLRADSSIVPSTPDSLERDALTPLSTPLPLEGTSEPNLLQREQVEEHLTAPSDSSTPAPVETTVNPTGVEPIEDTAIASSDPTISLYAEQVQARFEPAVSQPEAVASPLLDLPTEIGKLSSPEIHQQGTESVRENPAASPISPFTSSEVAVERSDSPSELPLPTLEQTTDAEPGTPTPDSPQPVQEPIPSLSTQNTSPQALTPTVQTESILQPQLDSASLSTTSATSSSAFDPGSVLSQSEAEATSPQNELKVETEVQPQSRGDVIPTKELSQTTHESVTESIEATEPAPTLPQSSSVSAPTPVHLETAVQEPTQNAIAPDSTSLPSTPAQRLESQGITTATDEETTPTQEATLQPISESTTIQRQVTEVSALNSLESNHQASDEELVADNIEKAEPAPTLQQSSSVAAPITVQPEASVQEPTQNAIATDSTSLPSTPAQPLESQAITTSTDEETIPQAATLQPISESTTIQRQVIEATAIQTPQEKAIASDFAPSAIAPASDSLPDSPPISPSTTHESSPGLPSTLQTDSLTSTEPNSIQPFHQPGTTNFDAVPGLPTVLQNLTVLDPLGSTPLIQTAAIEDTIPPREPPPVRVERRELPSPVFSSSSISAEPASETASTSSNREVVASVPDEWSSIAELLDRSSSSASPYSSPVSSPFPELQPFGATETAIQSQFQPVMRQISANPAATTQSDEERSQVTEVKADTEDVAAPSPEQLEKLAREIYGLVRQRLQIEQERSGSSYLGRLPW